MMRSLALGLAAGCMLLASIADAQEKSSGARLDSAEIEKLVWPAALFDGRNLTNGTWFGAAYGRGGGLQVVYISAEGIIGQNQGKWRIAGEAMCVELQYGEGEQCRHVFKLSDGSYEYRLPKDGKLIARFRVRRLE